MVAHPKLRLIHMGFREMKPPPEPFPKQAILLACISPHLLRLAE